MATSPLSPTHAVWPSTIQTVDPECSKMAGPSIRAPAFSATRYTGTSSSLPSLESTGVRRYALAARDAPLRLLKICSPRCPRSISATNWGLQRMWAAGTFQEIYKKNFKMDPPFHIWENGQLQPGVTEVGKDWDKW